MRATSWIERNVGAIGVGGFVTIHINELMGLSMLEPMNVPTMAIELALDAFRGLLDAPSVDLSVLMPVLVVTLEPRNEIDLTPVPWSALGHCVIEEPPTLYVIDRRALQLPNRTEEYRRSITPPFGLPGDVELHSFYRCYRDPRAQDHDWEFERSLYLEAHHRAPSVARLSAPTKLDSSTRTESTLDSEWTEDIAMSTVFDLLAAIEGRPGMYLGDPETGRSRQLDDLEMLLHGYSLALQQHALTGPGREFLRSFGEYLRELFGWSMSAGPTAAILAATSTDEDAWTYFWKLIGEYRTAIDVDDR